MIDYANSLVASGHSVTFYLKEMACVFHIDKRIQIVNVPCNGRLGFLLYPVFHLFNQDLLVVDIIHLVPCLRLKNPLVYFAQADDVEYYDSLWMRKVIDLLYRWYFGRKEPIITVSQYLADVFSARYHFNKSHVVTNGIDLENFFPDPDPELTRLKEKRKALLFMARGDHYRKGYDLALEVFSKLSRDDENKIELWICGEAIQENQYSFPVRNLGVVDDCRLRQVLSSADIFFYPSRHEGFGLFPLEAMACGCNVVTTEAIPYASQTAAICTAPIGDTFALAEHILRLIHDDHLYKQLRDLAISAARQYDMKISCRHFATTLAEIIKKSRQEQVDNQVKRLFRKT